MKLHNIVQMKFI